MGIILMPEVAADEIEAGIRLPVGTTPQQAAEIAHTVTDATLRMIRETFTAYHCRRCKNQCSSRQLC